ncbi:MAG: hypothetical protein KGL39_26010 [Patescibacteria group bacterium]|nr:hypothetical protein [Patescibacteria group bacterium]
MTASQFIAALQAGLNAAANAAASSPTQAGTAAPQVSSANNPTPAPVTFGQTVALASSPAGQTAAAQKAGDFITKYFSWLIPAGWTPAKLA